MIKNKKDLIYYLEQDTLAQGYTTSKSQKPSKPGHRLWKFTRTMRRYEYHLNLNHKILSLFYKNRFNKLCLKYGFYLCPNTFGPGLRIAHSGCIAVSGNCRIGRNCLIHQGTTIGENYGKKKGSPTIGDNVVIGANVTIIGSVVIPDNVIIGAGSAVTKTLEEPNAIYAGNPAKKIGLNGLSIIDKRLDR